MEITDPFHDILQNLNDPVTFPPVDLSGSVLPASERLILPLVTGAIASYTLRSLVLSARYCNVHLIYMTYVYIQYIQNKESDLMISGVS